MIGFRRCSIRIPKLRGKSLVRRFTLSAMIRTARFTLCLPTTRKNWKRRCCTTSIVVQKTGDLLRLRQCRQNHLLTFELRHADKGLMFTIAVSRKPSVGAIAASGQGVSAYGSRHLSPPRSDSALQRCRDTDQRHDPQWRERDRCDRSRVVGRYSRDKKV